MQSGSGAVENVQTTCSEAGGLLRVLAVGADVVGGEDLEPVAGGGSTPGPGWTSVPSALISVSLVGLGVEAQRLRLRGGRSGRGEHEDGGGEGGAERAVDHAADATFGSGAPHPGQPRNPERVS